jgi:hypothetical protein
MLRRDRAARENVLRGDVRWRKWASFEIGMRRSYLCA